MNILAIDQGTSSTRAILLTPEGRATPLHAVPLRQRYPRPGWVEQDAEDLLGSVVACLMAAGAAGDVAAVGLANQGESCLAWDAETGAALGPVIGWQDDRTREITDRLAREGAGAFVRERAGLPLDPYFSASKLAWLVHNLPDAPFLLRRGRLRLGTTDAFFRDRLCGRHETDVATASRTALLDLATGQWDADLCRLFGVPIAALPAITANTGELGIFKGNGLPLTASIVDQQASLYGHGCRVPGDAKITFGTGAFALAVTDRPVAGAGPVPTIAWQKPDQSRLYALDGGVYCASSAVNWGIDRGLIDDIGAIDDPGEPPAIARGLAFVPALAGLACPHWDRRARGAWFGLSLDTDSRQMMRAILEGVAFRMAEALTSIEAAQPLNGPISVDGGMTANAYFCQFLADALGRPISISAQPELTALGVAALAAEAVGLSLNERDGGRELSPRPLPSGAAARFQAARVAVRSYHMASSGEEI